MVTGLLSASPRFYGSNLLLNGAKEYVPWAEVTAEHAQRGHEWMEKFAVEDIWDHHCDWVALSKVFVFMVISMDFNGFLAGFSRC